MSRRPLALSVLLLIAFLPLGPAVAAESDPWMWPLPGHQVDQEFDKPRSAYGAGHRGVDLPGSAGDSVRAVAAGRVSYVGSVGGTPVVSISHGTERSTYQPVR